MGTRRKSRECALQMLFEIEMRQVSAETVIPDYWKNTGGADDMREFADSIVLGYMGASGKVDELIMKHIENWRFERLAAVDRNVLRIAVWELLEESGAPWRVVINEAIEIARKFGSNESAQFVNGVLDGIEKKLSSEKAS